MSLKLHIGGAYGGVFGKKIDLEVSREMLTTLGKCLVKAVSKEASKDWAKRGWSEWDDVHKVRISESFGWRIKGKRTVELTCRFSNITRLIEGVPRHPMPWLTQEGKDSYPSKYQLTEAEQEKGMKRGGRVSQGERLPLIVPLEGPGGTVIFRMAPLKTSEAWIHPGIAKFTFLRRGIEKGKQTCMETLGPEIVERWAQGEL